MKTCVFKRIINRDVNTIRNQSGIDMRDRDKNTVNGVGLLAVFAKRAKSVEKTLVYLFLHGGRQDGQCFQGSMQQDNLKTLGCDEIVRHKEGKYTWRVTPWGSSRLRSSRSCAVPGRYSRLRQWALSALLP